jgi:hypothetical protein
MARSEHRSRPVAVAIAIVLCVGVTASAGAASTAARASTTAATGARMIAGSKRRAAAARYLAIAKAGNRSLDHYFDRLEGTDRNRLARARADLHAIAATERLFDRRLSRIEFPVKAERIARSLRRINQKRAALTAAAARSSSLRELRDYERRLNAANRPVERAVRTIRRQLGLPPPATS